MNYASDIQLYPLNEISVCLYRSDESKSTEDEVRGRYTFTGR